MAKTYRLETSTDAVIDYNDINVEISEDVTQLKMRSVSRLNDEVSSIEAQITALEARKVVVQAELVGLKKKADLVLNATNKPA